MIIINLENGTLIPLASKSLFILPAGSKTDDIVNNKDGYDIIMIIAGIDRTVNMELLKPTIIVLDAGIRTTVNVKGGLALANSQAVLIGGLDNKVNGLATQNYGRIISSNGEEFDLGLIASFEKIKIGF